MKAETKKFSNTDLLEIIRRSEDQTVDEGIKQTIISTGASKEEKKAYLEANCCYLFQQFALNLNSTEQEVIYYLDCVKSLQKFNEDESLLQIWNTGSSYCLINQFNFMEISLELQMRSENG